MTYHPMDCTNRFAGDEDSTTTGALVAGRTVHNTFFWIKVAPHSELADTICREESEMLAKNCEGQQHTFTLAIGGESLILAEINIGSGVRKVLKHS